MKEEKRGASRAPKVSQTVGKKGTPLAALAPRPYPSLLLARFLVGRVLAFLPAELLELEPVGAARLLLGPVVPGPAIGAFEPNVFPHDELPSGSEACRCGCRNQWTTG